MIYKVRFMPSLLLFFLLVLVMLFLGLPKSEKIWHSSTQSDDTTYCRKTLTLADQDVLNLVGNQAPWLLQPLPCEWNYHTWTVSATATAPNWSQCYLSVGRPALKAPSSLEWNIQRDATCVQVRKEDYQMFVKCSQALQPGASGLSMETARWKKTGKVSHLPRFFGVTPFKGKASVTVILLGFLWLWEQWGQGWLQWRCRSQECFQLLGQPGEG